MALRGVRLGMPKRCPGVRALSVKRQYRTQGMKANPLRAEAAGQAHTPCPSFQVPGTPPGHMGLKHRLPVHVGRQGIQGLIHELAARCFSSSGRSSGLPSGCGMDTVGTMRLAPMLNEMGTMVHICTTGTSAVSSMLLASVAPQRVHVPQVEVRITPSTCAALI